MASPYLDEVAEVGRYNKYMRPNRHLGVGLEMVVVDIDVIVRRVQRVITEKCVSFVN